MPGSSIDDRGVCSTLPEIFLWDSSENRTRLSMVPGFAPRKRTVRGFGECDLGPMSSERFCRPLAVWVPSANRRLPTVVSVVCSLRAGGMMSSPSTLTRDEAIAAAAILGASCSGASAPVTRSGCRRRVGGSGGMPVPGAVTRDQAGRTLQGSSTPVNRVCSVSQMGWCGIFALRVEDVEVGMLL